MSLFRRKKKDVRERREEVADYYDKYTEGYLKTYGDTIQAFRPASLNDLHDYVVQHAGISDGMELLDAGCGVAGPACAFAKRKDVRIDGVTISPGQKRFADENIAEKGLTDRVSITCGDYHELSSLFPDTRFDMVYFLESLGHAKDSGKVMEEAWEVLKPGGHIYIKDFFPFDIVDIEKAQRHHSVIERINDSYTYNVLYLENTVRKLRQLGFEIIFIKKFEFQDDIKARADFETMFDIDLFGDMEEFRVAEWLELKFRKPVDRLF